MASWRAVQTVAGLEPIANEALRKDGVNVFYPRRRIRLHRRGSPHVERAYFPNYVFVDLDGQHLHRIMRARGVLHVLGSCPIPDHVMAALIAQADPQGYIADPMPELGRTYALARPGGLGTLLAKVHRLDEASRAVVLIRLLGLERQAVVSLADLDTTHPVPALLFDRG